ncbi:MAG TPA: lipase [Pseudonocardiaceae bacterium]|nr:lipase [Pseudonocardiaceae bacterium]
MAWSGWWGGRSARRRALLVGVLACCVLAAVVVAVRLSSGGDSAVPAGYPDQSTPGPVVLVPGYGGNTSALNSLAEKIRATGRSAEVLPLPDGGTGDLTVQVRALSSAVARELAGGAASVDVVGYSAGGVVARLWVAQDGGAHEARRIVTLGSPLHGARIAAVGANLVPGACPTACQQLAPGSALLRQLDAQPLPTELPWLSLWSEDDQTVTPPDSARLAGAVNVPVQQVCPAEQVAHAQLPTDPLVTGIVLAALSETAVTAPNPAQCQALLARGRGQHG